MIRFALLLTVLAAPAMAETPAPSFDCAKTDSDADRAICASDTLAGLDLELARLYALALSGPSMDDARKEELRQSERDWLNERHECWRSSLGIETCLAVSYALRIHDLREGYAGARSDDAAGISSGPGAWRCDGLDALISSVFINAETPMVSLRWLDRQLALPLVPAGSGAKYESDWWDGDVTTFWTKGDEALFTPAGGTDLACVREPIG